DGVAPGAAHAARVPGVEDLVAAARQEEDAYVGTLGRETGTVAVPHQSEQRDPVGGVDGADDVPTARQPKATAGRLGLADRPRRVGDDRVAGPAPDRVGGGVVEHAGGEAQVAVPHVPGDRPVDPAEVLVEVHQLVQRQLGTTPLDRCGEAEGA